MQLRVGRSVRRFFRAAGFEIQRIGPAGDSYQQLFRTLRHCRIDTVFDVGANAGQFAGRLRDAGFSGRIVSFEPLREAHAELRQRAAHDGEWFVHERSAIGSSDQKVTINVAANSVSSSVLPMSELHAEASRSSRYVGSEVVRMTTLDSVASDYVHPKSRLLLKIDTQGNEWSVLDGARQLMTQVHGIVCETSLVPLYEGQKLCRNVVHRLEELGFEIWAIQRGFTDPRNGRTLQVDVTMVRVVAAPQTRE